MQDTPDDVRRDEATDWPPSDQQAQPTTPPQAGNEGDPSLRRDIPGTETGEQRWAGAGVGESVEENRQATPGPRPPGDEGYLEEPGGTAPSEAYGQGETREFTPLGADRGIEQQEVLQSQQYEAEERRSDQGFLGAIGEKLRSLFGNAPRPPRDDTGEDAGEAHP
jgi:hypothetical protein